MATAKRRRPPRRRLPSASETCGGRSSSRAFRRGCATDGWTKDERGLQRISWSGSWSRLLGSDFGGVVVAADVRGFLISLAAPLVVAGDRLGLSRRGRPAGDRGCRCSAADACCDEEVPAAEF